MPGPSIPRPTPWVASVLFSQCHSTPNPSQTLAVSRPGWETHIAHRIQSCPGALLQPPSSYPTRWESSCRLWAHRKLSLGAGTGGGGAAVMSRETDDDNRQTDGMGARGRRASNAHPRPSFGARQSGTQNGIPGERWSRIRGPQLRNLIAEGNLGAVSLHLGRGKGTPVLRHRGTQQNWTRLWFLLFLTSEALGAQGIGNGYSGHSQANSLQASCPLPEA